MLFGQGKLEKMTLRAFKTSKDVDAKPELSDASYTVQVNPSTYTLSHLLSHSRHLGLGATSSEAVYAGSPPVNLQFEFLFDSTGVVPAPSELSDIPLVGAIASALSPDEPFVVMDEIEKFNALVYEVDGDIHSPRRLRLSWGTLIFDCVLSSLNYRFTLFKQDGTPLRAVAACTFCESIPNAQQALEDNLHSPDLTHLRDVREGDTLPLLASEVYGNPQLYLEVARVNRLVNFRRLRPATRVTFPPIDKEVTR